jgi:hypothetical protein
MKEQEEWRPLIGYEATHEVSNMGRLRSVDRTIETTLGPRRLRGKVLATFLGPYEQTTITIDRKVGLVRVHVAVAAAFIGPRPEGAEVCHNDGDRANNAATNLRYDTHTANCQDTVQMGRNVLAVRTHCGHGHEFTPENTAIRKDSAGQRARRCLTCKRGYGKRSVA